MNILFIILGILSVICIILLFKRKKINEHADGINPNDGRNAEFTVPVTINRLIVRDIENPEINKLSSDINSLNANVTTITANILTVSANVSTISTNIAANISSVSANVDLVNTEIKKLKNIDNFNINSGKNIETGTLSCKPIDSSYTIDDCANECIELNTDKQQCYGFAIEKNLNEMKCCLKNINVLNKNLIDNASIDYYKLKTHEIPSLLKQYNIYFDHNNSGNIIDKGRNLTKLYTLDDCARECSNLNTCGGFLHNKVQDRCILKNMKAINNPLESIKNFDFYYKKNNNNITCDKNSSDKCLFRFYNYDPKTDSCIGPSKNQKYNNNDIRNITEPEYKEWLTKKYNKNEGLSESLFNDNTLINEYLSRCNYKVPDIKNNVNSKWKCLDSIKTAIRYNKNNDLECLSNDGNVCSIYDNCDEIIKPLNINKDNLNYNTVVCKENDYNDKNSICTLGKQEMTKFDKNINVSCLIDRIPDKPKETTLNYKYIGDFDTYEDCIKTLKVENINDKYKTITWFNQDADNLKKQCYISDNDIIKNDNPKTVCGIKTIDSEQILEEGRSYACNPQNKGSVNPLNIYRYVNNQLRPYGNKEVADSWDPLWYSKYGVINCTNIPIGTKLLKKP